MFGQHPMTGEEKAAAKSSAVDLWRKAALAWHGVVDGADAACAMGAMSAFARALRAVPMIDGGKYPSIRRAKTATGLAESAWLKAVEAIDAAVAATNAAAAAVSEVCLENPPEKATADGAAEAGKPGGSTDVEADFSAKKLALDLAEAVGPKTDA